MTDYKQDDIVTNGVKLHYYSAGTGKQTIVLLHGATDNGMCWKRLSDVLMRDYTVIMPDALGHGLSDRLGDDFQFVDHAHQAAGFIRELGIEKPVIVGHSMGGSTAANVAALYPDLPAGIVLEDPGWMDPTANTQPPDRKATIDMQKKTIDELSAQCREEHPSWDEIEIAPWAESKKQYDAKLFDVLKINEPPYLETVSKIKCPTLLISAESGIVNENTIKAVSGKWSADKPLQHIKIMDAGHNIRREQFDIFYSSFISFVESL